MSDYYASAEDTLPLFAVRRIDTPIAAARRTDPATSHAAAAMAGGVRADHNKRILAALRLGPASKDEIGARAGLIGHAVGKRMPDLRRAGLVELTGADRRSASGRPEREWRLKTN